MRVFVLSLVALFVVWLEVALGGYIEYQGVTPDLMLIYVVFISLSFSLESAVVASGLLGVLRDMTSALPLGTFSLLFTIASLLTLVARRYLFKQSVAAQFLMTFLAACTVHGLCGIVLVLNDGGYTWGGAALRTLWISTYTALCAPLLLFLLSRALAKFLPASARRP